MSRLFSGSFSRGFFAGCRSFFSDHAAHGFDFRAISKCVLAIGSRGLGAVSADNGDLAFFDVNFRAVSKGQFFNFGNFGRSSVSSSARATAISATTQVWPPQRCSRRAISEASMLWGPTSMID